MKLSFKQIKELTVGAIRYTEALDHLEFDHYTESQIAAFAEAAPVLGERAQNTCGIRMDMHTDARAIQVSVASAGKYEVLVNDLTVFAQTFEQADSFTVRLPEGDQRITLILPSHSRGSIRSVELDNATYAKPHTYTKKIAFYGDSITQGWESQKDSQSYAYLVSRYFDAESLILGVGGARFTPDTVEEVGFDADAVIVALGTNDYGKGFPLSYIQETSKEYLRRIHAIYAGKKIFCITPTWRADENVDKNGLNLDEVRRSITENAEQFGMIVVDGTTLMPHRTEYYADAIVHPNDVGFALYAMNLIKILNQHI